MAGEGKAPESSANERTSSGQRPMGVLNPFARRCGRASLSERGLDEIARWPYVQQPSPATVAIVYRRSSPETELDEVEITEPDGELVSIVPTRADPAAADGLQRVAPIEGLRPWTYYCYSLIGLTSRIGFRTPPLRGATTPLRFAVFGDSGNASDAQRAVRDQLVRYDIDLMLHTGDIAYERGTIQEFDRNYFEIYRRLIASVPVFPVPGNHEYATESAAPFREVFVLPENGAPSGAERWYSFDWGNVHFIALDTQLVNAEQAGWLERDLSANQRHWTVAYMHRPAYSSGAHGGSEAVKSMLVPILQQHGVTVVFAGHDHDYERTLPIDGVTYVVTGGGGKGLRDVGRSPFTVLSRSVFHFVLVDVSATTMRLRAVDLSGTEIDSVDITR